MKILIFLLLLATPVFADNSSEAESKPKPSNSDEAIYQQLFDAGIKEKRSSLKSDAVQVFQVKVGGLTCHKFVRGEKSDFQCKFDIPEKTGKARRQAKKIFKVLTKKNSAKDITPHDDGIHFTNVSEIRIETSDGDFVCKRTDPILFPLLSKSEFECRDERVREAAVSDSGAKPESESPRSEDPKLHPDTGSVK